MQAQCSKQAGTHTRTNARNNTCEHAHFDHNDEFKGSHCFEHKPMNYTMFRAGPNTFYCLISAHMQDFTPPTDVLPYLGDISPSKTFQNHGHANIFKETKNFTPPNLYTTEKLSNSKHILTRITQTNFCFTGNSNFSSQIFTPGEKFSNLIINIL